jgi:carboxymethylenebutenolidase
MGTVRIATTSGGMPAYDARPSGEQRGAVVVIQEAFGVTAHIEDVARRCADAGYRAVAPHLFYRTGDPVLSYDDIASVRPHMGSLTEEGLLDDLDATFGYLDDAGFAASRVGVVGFCMGGTVSFLAGARRPLGAAVSFYGGGVAEGRFGMAPLVELAPRLQSPWLGLYGDQDQTIPVEQVEALREAAGRASVPTELVRYPEAGHGFHCDDRPAAFHEASAKDAWARTRSWFEEHVSAGG